MEKLRAKGDVVLYGCRADSDNSEEREREEGSLFVAAVVGKLEKTK